MLYVQIAEYTFVIGMSLEMHAVRVDCQYTFVIGMSLEMRVVRADC